jgi:purine-binding chemotaxis protein CheW
MAIMPDIKQQEVIKKVAQKVREEKEKVVEMEQLVTFELDKEEYASVITDLREIIKIPEIVPIPGSPKFIKGILNLRGQIVVIVDLEKRFSLTREHKVSPRHIIIIELEENVFGVVVDEVTGVLRVPVTSIRPTPSLVSSKIQTEYLKGVVILEDEILTQGEKLEETPKKQDTKEKNEKRSRLILLLDIPKMLSEKELLEFGKNVQETVVEEKDVESDKSHRVIEP